LKRKEISGEEERRLDAHLLGREERGRNIARQEVENGGASGRKKSPRKKEKGGSWEEGRKRPSF